ncbi:hypothetical protein D3C78_1046730 [compost metagenome]
MEQLSFSRAMRQVVLLSFLYALISNGFLYAAYYSPVIVEWSYVIALLLIVVISIPIIIWFFNRYWYFPAFIFMFWIPFSVLLAYFLYQVLPTGSNDYEFGLLLLFYLILDVFVVVAGIGLGMAVNGIRVLSRRRLQQAGKDTSGG